MSNILAFDSDALPIGHAHPEALYTIDDLAALPAQHGGEEQARGDWLFEQLFGNAAEVQAGATQGAADTHATHTTLHSTHATLPEQTSSHDASASSAVVGSQASHVVLQDPVAQAATTTLSIGYEMPVRRPPTARTRSPDPQAAQAPQPSLKPTATTSASRMLPGGRTQTYKPVGGRKRRAEQEEAPERSKRQRMVAGDAHPAGEILQPHNRPLDDNVRTIRLHMPSASLTADKQHDQVALHGAQVYYGGAERLLAGGDAGYPAAYPPVYPSHLLPAPPTPAYAYAGPGLDETTYGVWHMIAQPHTREADVTTRAVGEEHDFPAPNQDGPWNEWGNGADATLPFSGADDAYLVAQWHNDARADGQQDEASPPPNKRRQHGRKKASKTPVAGHNAKKHNATVTRPGIAYAALWKMRADDIADEARAILAFPADTPVSQLPGRKTLSAQDKERLKQLGPNGRARAIAEDKRAGYMACTLCAVDFNIADELVINKTKVFDRHVKEYHSGAACSACGMPIAARDAEHFRMHRETCAMFHALVRRGCYWEWMLHHGLVRPQLTGKLTNDEFFDTKQHGAARRAANTIDALHNMLEEAEVEDIREAVGMPRNGMVQPTHGHARYEAEAGPSRLPVEDTADTVGTMCAWNAAGDAEYAPMADPDGSHLANAAARGWTGQKNAGTQQARLQAVDNGDKAGRVGHADTLAADADGLQAAAAAGFTIDANGWLVNPARY
ncbi:hypothetical protein AURDEDRAFT_122612 [Auricularia subglabra TFB-10046 SS5]|nr:hypothetical protein AURDEDRAFT_122612 [Auricularia subglabra TFB-10046 SS5]